MKNKSIIKFLLSITFLATFVAGCSIDSTINESPNGIGLSALKTQDGQYALLIALQTGAGEFYWGDRSRVSSVWTRQMHAIPGLGRPQTVTLNLYQLTPDGPAQDMWNVGFKTIRVANDIITYCPETDFGSNSAAYRATLTGIAEAYKAMILGELAAYYGSIPITQNGLAIPTFVSQADAYKEVQRLLDDAVAKFGSAVAIAQDLNFKGDKAKWLSVCHSLKARYYLHVKDYSNAKASAAMGIQDAANNLMAIFSENIGEQGPWAHWKNDESGEPLRVEKTFMDLLQAEAGDKRIAEYFTPNFGTTFFGYPGYGQQVSDTNASKGQNIASLKKYSGYGDALPLVTLAENAFIFAEAEARVGALPVAVVAINKVRTTFGLPDIKATDAADKDKVIAEVLKQKHLTLFLEGQTYTDMRRTGTLPEAAVPKRFRYPISETNANPNVPKDDDALVSAILP